VGRDPARRALRAAGPDNRQDALRRKREIEVATTPFLAWMRDVSGSGVFTRYNSVRDRLADDMPWIWDNLERAMIGRIRLDRLEIPKALFVESTDPEADFQKVASEIGVATLTLMGKAQSADKTLAYVVRRLETLLKRVESVLEQLKEVEDFFQPAMLTAVCAFANENDNSRKRRYEHGLLRLTCKRERNDVTVCIPKRFAVPNRAAIDTFRSALVGFRS
jgi:hypothetical protein